VDVIGIEQVMACKVLSPHLGCSTYIVNAAALIMQDTLTILTILKDQGLLPWLAHLWFAQSQEIKVRSRVD
jgi:hypothetical protein